MRKLSNIKTWCILIALTFIAMMVSPVAAQDKNYRHKDTEKAVTKNTSEPIKTNEKVEKKKAPTGYSDEVQNILNRVTISEEPVDETLADNNKANALNVSASTYTLGPTDIIQISVMRHPEVSGDFMINQEGKIQYEFVGDILISGLYKEQVEKKISDALEEYIISPEVSVKITGYNSKIVYVVGEVGAPGKIFMRGDTITVREALMQAGLPRLTGKTRKSKLITPTENGEPDVRPVDVYALLYEGDLRHNLSMEPGDVIFIPATFLTKTMRAIQPVAAPIGTAAGTGRTVTTGF